MIVIIFTAILLVNFGFWVLIILKGKRPDGVILITEDPDGKKTFSLELAKTPEEIESMKMIFFKVIPMSPDTIILYPPRNDDIVE